MKIPVQQKIAELESRIAALEKAARMHVYTRTTVTGAGGPSVDLEPEMSGIWKSVDALFKKAFR